MQEIYYQVLFEDTLTNDRYLSDSVFTKNELLNNDINDIKRNTYLRRYPDAQLMDEIYLSADLKRVFDIGIVPVIVELNE